MNCEIEADEIDESLINQNLSDDELRDLLLDYDESGLYNKFTQEGGLEVTDKHIERFRHDYERLEAFMAKNIDVFLSYPEEDNSIVVDDTEDYVAFYITDGWFVPQESLGMIDGLSDDQPVAYLFHVVLKRITEKVAGRDQEVPVEGRDKTIGAPAELVLPRPEGLEIPDKAKKSTEL